MYIYRKYSQFLLPRQGKRMFAVYLICSLASTLCLHSMENNGRGTKAIGMANAFVAVSDNLWAVNYNPAGLTQIKSIQCSAFIVPGQFGLPELRTTTLSAAVPFSFAAFALKAEKFGFDLYKETEIGMSFALKLDQNISGGLSLNLHRFDIAGYGNKQSFLLNGGILANALDNVKLGFSFSNITGASIGRTDEKITQLFSLGASWTPIDDLLLSFEIEKDIRYHESIKCGIEQKVFGVLAFQAGIASNPAKYSAGITIIFPFFEFGYACYSHINLGWTHQIEIICRLDN